MNLRDLWPWLKAEFRWRVLGKRYKVILEGQALETFNDLPEDVKVEFMKSIEHLSRNPYSGDRMELDDEEAGA